MSAPSEEQADYESWQASAKRAQGLAAGPHPREQARLLLLRATRAARSGGVTLHAAGLESVPGSGVAAVAHHSTCH